MKKLKTNENIWIFLIAFLVLGVFSFAQDKAPDPLQEKLKVLTEQLNLTEAQVSQVEKVLKMVGGQASMDRETFKGNPEALITAAKRRLDMIDTQIENMITPEQMAKFDYYKKQRMRKWEFFMIKEGLVLNQDESEAIEDIIDKYSFGQGGMREPMGGDFGGGGPGRPGGPGGGMMRGGRPGGRMNPMKQIESKKNSEIKKVLTKEQWKQYKIIKKLIDAEKERFMKGRQENMQENMRQNMRQDMRQDMREETQGHSIP